jgi:hypothetical protein
MGEFKGLIFPFVLATALHVVFINIEIPKNPQKETNIPMERVSISRIDSALLKRLRTVGIKNGSKDFSAPTNKQNFNMASLAPKKIKNVKGKKEGPKLKGVSTTSAPDLLTVVGGGSADFAMSPQIRQAFKSTNLNVAFEPPEGVDKDKLNSVEKKFYGFSKRTYDLYVSSLIRSLNNILRERPYLNFMELDGSYQLVGKIAFNTEGDAISTRFLKVANQDDVQQLFENTLMDIKVIPNPPKELLKKDGTFSIYYKLHVGL